MANSSGIESESHPTVTETGKQKDRKGAGKGQGIKDTKTPRQTRD
jgi:hypothetical protein